MSSRFNRPSRGASTNWQRKQLVRPDVIESIPPSPIVGTRRLVPITSWSALTHECKITGVVIDLFWCESLVEGVCYFFRWVGKRRATVLTVFSDGVLDFVECRTTGDRLIPACDAMDIIYEVSACFMRSGFSADPDDLAQQAFRDADDSADGLLGARDPAIGTSPCPRAMRTTRERTRTR